MRRHAVILVGAVLAIAGCGESKWASSLPQQDPALRKTKVQFAADAATRTYPADAPHKMTNDLRAQVEYGVKWLDIANLTDQEWDDVDVWLNQRYVIHVPKIPAKHLERLWFRGMYDQQGHSFPTDKLPTLVQKLEVFKDGVLYDLPVHLAD